MNYQSAPAEVVTVIGISAFLYREARLLDEHRFEEWLELFTDDATYVLPIKDAPPPEPALIRDSKSRMEERVYRLTRTFAPAQSPPSLTQHDVTNVEVLGEEASGALLVACNMSVHELRQGDAMQPGIAEQRSFHARCYYKLVRSGEAWLIKEKRCRLLNREYPVYNLTFIF